MLQFNELRITPDGKNLIIDAQVQELDYYENVYIDSISFDIQDTYNVTGPSQKAVKIYDSKDDTSKHIRITWDIDILKDKLFFVYISAKGTPAEDTPCGLKDTLVMGIVYNQYPIYALVMKALQEIEGCVPPQDLINFFLRFKAFKICLKAGNYMKAIEYWNRFFGDQKRLIISKCGCHG